MIKFFDMFAGIGGFRAGLERAGGYECIGHCEIDKHADTAYRATYNVKESEVFYEDATKIDTETMPEFDLLCAGFPCQSFSVAGKRQGFSDPRGTMFFEIARLARARRPAYLLLENVPGLLSHDQGRTFTTILDTLCELGYSVEWQILNSKNFGVAQSRRRVYIVGYLDRECAGKVLPIRETNREALIQLVGGQQDSRVYDSSGLAKTLLAKPGGLGGKTGLYFIDMSVNDPKITTYSRCLTARYNHGVGNRKGESSGVVKLGNVNPSGRGQNGNAYSSDGLSPTLTTNKGEGIKVSLGKSDEKDIPHAVLSPERETVRQNGRRIKDAEEPMFTLTSQDRHGVLFIKEATKRGFKEATLGDSIDYSFSGSNKRRGRVGSAIAHTIDTGCKQAVMTVLGRIRRLIPRECFRLQGFSEEQIDRLLSVSSDNQAYKQAGNAVTVNVVHTLALRLKTAHEGCMAIAWAENEAA